MTKLTDVANILARSRFDREVTDAQLAQQVIDTVAQPDAQPKARKPKFTPPAVPGPDAA